MCQGNLFKQRLKAIRFVNSTRSSVGCFSFGPEPIRSPDIWSPTIGPQEQTVPAHLVPMDKWSPRQLVPLDNWSPNIWSPWTNGPQENWSPWTNSPQIFGPHGQMVPKTIGPRGQLVPEDNWSPRTIGPQNLLVVSKSIMEPFFQFFDIGWSTLDIMDDFKPPKKIYLRFGKSLLFVFVQKHFFHFYFELEFKQKII